MAVKTARPISHIEKFVPRQHGRSFVWHVGEARRFRERGLREHCPGWAWNTHVKYPKQHPEFFLDHGRGFYSLVENEESPGGCIRSR